MNNHVKFMARGKSDTAVEGQEVGKDERAAECNGMETKRNGRRSGGWCGGGGTGVSKVGERRREEEQQRFATEGTRVREMSGREQGKTLRRRATVRTSVVTQTEIKACGRSFDSCPKEAKKLSVLCRVLASWRY